MVGTPRPEAMSTRCQRIAALARQAPELGFTTLSHHLDIAWLTEAYRRTRKDGAVGVDGQTAAAYEANLQENLQALLNRAKSGTYQAPPVRRVHIPKAGSLTETRPIGIPTFEDKVLQRAIAMVLEPIYEQDFYDCSYGFRPKRSAHQALEKLWRQAMRPEVGWIVEVDIRQFFDTLDHAQLRALLKRRVRDGVVLRLLGKWLNAGVLEDGEIFYPEAGSPQGGVISPTLSNIYLHYVLDDWFEREVKPRLRGYAFLVRYADDFVMGFASERDARRVLDVLPKRFGKYGLTVHPDKTQLVRFTRPAASDRKPPTATSGATPGSFDFLGFTHYIGRSRKGTWVVQRKTAASRLRRTVRKLSAWCKRHRHRPLPEQHQKLSRKLWGHYTYYGITGNSRALGSLYYAVLLVWKKWLSRRSWHGTLFWAGFERLLQRLPLPRPRIVHSVYRRIATT